MPVRGNNVKNVTVGKPKVGGAVFMAPSGTPLPATASEELNAAFEALGYISEDGATNSGTRTVENIKEWGGEIVRNPQTEKTDTWKMKFIEALSLAVLKLTHGNDNVTGELETGITVRENAKELDRYVFVIDTVLNEYAIKRIVIPDGKVTEIADVVYKANEVVGYDCTITAYAYNEEGYGGDTHRELIQGVSDGGDDPTPGPTPTLKTLTITSESGSELGTTAITVAPEKDTDNIYVYKLAEDETAVTYDAVVAEWTEWDGETEIEAETDQVITVVEATSDYKARGAGHATVVIR